MIFLTKYRISLRFYKEPTFDIMKTMFCIYINLKITKYIYTHSLKLTIKYINKNIGIL